MSRATPIWIRELIGGASFDRLARELTGSELSSLLLEVVGVHAEARTPREVLAQYERDGFCRPAAGDLRTSIAIDGHLLEAAKDFEALELAPVTPLATCSSVALSAQHRVLSALRATEVVSDPTNVLALECAARVRSGATDAHLATSQRVLRAQPVPKQPGFSPHFRLFALASGGIEAKDHAFTVEVLARHIRTMLAALRRLEGHGYAFGARYVQLLATPARAALADRIASILSDTDIDTSIDVRRGLLEHAYYSGGLRYQIWVTARDGAVFPLIDGGTFDWLTKLTANRRAVFVASGCGAQLIALRFAV